MKKVNHHLLFAAGVVLPLAILFWPFASWHGLFALVLRMLPAAVLQYLFCSRAKRPWLEAAPLLLTVALAIWGTWLFFTSPHWADATVWGLLADYCSPALAACGIWLSCGPIRTAKDVAKWIFWPFVAVLLVCLVFHMAEYPVVISDYPLTDAMKADMQRLGGGFYSIQLPLFPAYIRVNRVEGNTYSITTCYFPSGSVTWSLGSDGYSMDKRLSGLQ